MNTQWDTHAPAARHTQTALCFQRPNKPINMMKLSPGDLSSDTNDRAAPAIRETGGMSLHRPSFKFRTYSLFFLSFLLSLHSLNRESGSCRILWPFIRQHERQRWRKVLLLHSTSPPSHSSFRLSLLKIGSIRHKITLASFVGSHECVY